MIDNSDTLGGRNVADKHQYKHTEMWVRGGENKVHLSSHRLGKGKGHPNGNYNARMVGVAYAQHELIIAQIKLKSRQHMENNKKKNIITNAEDRH